MSGILADTLVVRNAAAVTAEVDGQLVALDVESGTCYGLNTVATEIWRLIDVPSSASMLASALIERFDIDRETCESETLGLLRGLVSAKLAAPFADSSSGS